MSNILSINKNGRQIDYINHEFIKPGELHEIGEPQYEYDHTKGQSKFIGMKWEAIYIESVEVIGGHVFLGLRDVFNWIDDKNYEIGETVRYENLMIFSRIQRIGTAKRRDDEIKAHNDLLLEKQKELQTQQ